VRLIRNWFNGAKLPAIKRRHQFAIFRNAPNDPFGGRGAIYLCVRCRWSFAVRGRTIVALDDSGAPMSGEESRARFATFEEGPCRGLRHLSSKNGAAIHLVRAPDVLKPRTNFGG
jgi:hypothetical protein